MRGGSKAAWNFSENSSVLVGLPVLNAEPNETNRSEDTLVCESTLCWRLNYLQQGQLCSSYCSSCTFKDDWLCVVDIFHIRILVSAGWYNSTRKRCKSNNCRDIWDKIRWRIQFWNKQWLQRYLLRARIVGGFDLARRGSKECPFGKQVDFAAKFAVKMKMGKLQ